MQAISRRSLHGLIAVGAAALLVAVAACTDPVERAENPEPAASAMAAPAAEGSSVCPPGGNSVDPVRDAVEWAPGEDGRQIVRLWRFRTVKTYGADECGDAPAGSLLRARTSRRLIWERAWPDDFREDAARLGWPAELIDRCSIGLVQTIADAYVRGACLELEEDLFYGSENPPPSASHRLPAPAFLVRAVDLGYEIDEIRRCRDQLYDWSDPASPSLACLSMLQEAEAVGGDGATARDVHVIQCPPGGSDGGLAQDYSAWQPDGDGTWTVQLRQHRATPVEGAVCGETGTIAVVFDSAGERMLWEKTWPDDFREDAVGLGWPSEAVDRCGPEALSSSSDPVLHRVCFALHAELFYATPEAIALAAEEARLNPGLHVARPSNDDWAAGRLAACKAALAEALPRGVMPPACRADAAAAAVQR